MRIISWNCNGNFRSKYRFIAKENADIYVIQECENPLNYPKEFDGFFSNYKWIGEKDSKGLAIFVKNGIHIKENDWKTNSLRHFISIKISETFDLIGVWASPPYIEEYYEYQSINIEKYTDETILIGDFNSNAIWDKKHSTRNHSVVVDELSKKEIVSAYHYLNNEKHGEETQKTFYLYRHKDKCYHIDYCFLNPKYLKNFEILDNDEWLKMSDHLPILVEIY